MSDYKKITVIGSADTILPFRSIGAEVFEVDNAHDAIENIRTIASQGVFGILLVEETLIQSLLDVVSHINNQYRDIAIISIPGTSGEGGVALKNLRAQVARAIGMDIFTQ